MRRFVEKTLLIVLSEGVLYPNILSLNSVGLLLLAYSLAMLLDLYETPKFKWVLLAGLVGLVVSVPSTTHLMPIAIYCTIQLVYPWGIGMGLLLLLTPNLYVHLVGIVAIYLAIRTQVDQHFQRSSTQERDQLEWYQMQLRRQHLQLEKDQLKNVEIAILAERNRISHHLHDALGHMISSSILQLESLKIISKEPVVQDRLTVLSSRMQQGMTDVRQNIHQLYATSFDLKVRIEEACQSLEVDEFHFAYAIKSPLALSFKIDVLSVVKELITNFQKHSNATEIRLKVIEQPAFYVLSYTDNGTYVASRSGMGLLAMKETAEKYKGTCTVQTTQGFGVHMTFMKGEATNDSISSN